MLSNTLRIKIARIHTIPSKKGNILLSIKLFGHDQSFLNECFPSSLTNANAFIDSHNFRQLNY